MKQSDQRWKGAIEGGGEQSGIEVVVSTCPVVCSLALIALSLYIYYAETKLTFSFVYQAEQIAEMRTAYFSHLNGTTCSHTDFFQRYLITCNSNVIVQVMIRFSQSP